MASRELSFVLLIIFVIFSEIAFCDDKNVVYRLPNDTAPEHYLIHIRTKIEKDNFKFSGNCTITVRVLLETKKIVLHSKLGQIRNVEMLSPKNVNLRATFEQTKASEFLTIAVEENLRKDQLYTLRISYSSRLRTDKLGFYRASYNDDLGNKVWLAATQFAPTEARHAFPCYDEPNRKAAFELEITHPTELTAISNRAALKVKDNADGTSTTSFETTAVMSTYLVGFVISNFEKAISGSRQLLHEVYARPNRILNAVDPAKFAKQLWLHLTDFFEEKFPEVVIKHVALPDSYFRATENWGILMYKERALLFKSVEHSTETKLRTISLIGKELAHSWFGNLVTMDWWTYAWLKEGFSTLYGYEAAEMGWPDYNFMEVFVVECLLPVFKIDGTTKTRPMTHAIEKPSEIIMSFDKIASDKAASVLRMLKHAFGGATFKAAVNKYVGKRKFGSANEMDLIDCFSEAMPKYPREYVEDIIKSWTSQKGYPLITVTRDYNASSLTIVQERFMNNGDLDKISLWHIPINFETENTSSKFKDTSPDIWMSERTLNLKGIIDNGKNVTLDPAKWIILNKQQTGFYRVNYDQSNWELITQTLTHNHLSINVFNRAQLIDDSFSLAAAGRLKFSTPLKLISYMGKEQAFAPWGALSTHVKVLKRHLRRTKYFVSLSKYFIQIAQMQMPKNIEDDSLYTLNTKVVLSLICEFDINMCAVTESHKRDANFRFYYYCHKMHKFGNLTYVNLRNLLRKEEDVHIRHDILSSFGCAQTKGLLSFFLSSTIEHPTDLKLTEDERVHLLKSIYRKSEWGFNITIAFIVREWKAIDSLLPGLLDEIIPDLAQNVNSYALKKTFNSMILKIKMLKPETLTEASTEITNNLRWLFVNGPDIDTFLKNSSVSHLLSSCSIVLFCILLLLM